MKAIDHRAEAERHASKAAHTNHQDHPQDPVATDFHLRLAQVHATLARDDEKSETLANLRDANTLLRRREYATRDLVSTHIAKALVSKNVDRWKAARSLAQALDEADANMDRAIDSRLRDDGYDAKTAWNGPGTAVAADDPWTPKPDITADIPEPVRRVITERLAGMLLYGHNDALNEAARQLAFALKNEGADLTPDIEKRISDLTLGRDPSEPPF